MRTTLIAIAASLILVSGASARAPASHWCRQGDPPIHASSATSCTLAAVIVDGYVSVCHKAARCSLRAPDRRKRERIACRRIGARDTGYVHCTGRGGIWVSFSADI